MRTDKDKMFIDLLFKIAKYDRNELDLTKTMLNNLENVLLNQSNIRVSILLNIVMNLEQSTYEQQRSLMDVAC